MFMTVHGKNSERRKNGKNKISIQYPPTLLVGWQQLNRNCIKNA